MTEFAFSGVGINPHYGTPANPADARHAAHSRAARRPARRCRWPPARPSSAWAPTPAARSAFRRRCAASSASRARRAWCRHGALPLSTTLDTVCAMTRSVRDAVTVHEILAARQVTRRQAAVRLPPGRGQDADAGRRWSRTVAQAFERSCRFCAPPARASTKSRWRRSATWRPSRPPAASRPPRAMPGTASCWPNTRPATTRACAAHPARRQHEGGRLHRPGGARRAWIAAWKAPGGFDAVLSPTVPMVAPPIASVAPGAERDDEFLPRQRPAAAQHQRGQHARRLRDLPALPHAGELPVGLMLWHAALHDDDVLDLASGGSRAGTSLQKTTACAQA
jgi:aspartyl-tRNA(Asn)/glutamyl-tRNA(Gln) amidotransferase subunit A